MWCDSQCLAIDEILAYYTTSHNRQPSDRVIVPCATARLGGDEELPKEMLLATNVARVSLPRQENTSAPDIVTKRHPCFYVRTALHENLALTWHQSSQTGQREARHTQSKRFKQPNNQHHIRKQHTHHLSPSLLLRRSAPHSTGRLYRHDMAPITNPAELTIANRATNTIQTRNFAQPNNQKHSGQHHTHLHPSLLLRRSAPLSSRTTYHRDMTPNWPSRNAPHIIQTMIHTHNRTTSTTSENITHTPHHLYICADTRRSPREHRVDVTSNRTTRTAHARTTHTNARYTTRTSETTTHAPLAALLLSRTAPLSRSRSTPALKPRCRPAATSSTMLGGVSPTCQRFM